VINTGHMRLFAWFSIRPKLGEKRVRGEEREKKERKSGEKRFKRESRHSQFTSSISLVTWSNFREYNLMIILVMM
jgi:hypothetical protein